MKKTGMIICAVCMVAGMGAPALAGPKTKGAYNTSEMVEKTRKVLTENKNISEDQRQKLLTLYGQTMEKMAKVRKEMVTSKKALFEALLAPTDQSSKMNKIEKKLVKLNDSKMDIMLDTMKEAKKILGKQASMDIFKHLDFEQGHQYY